MQVVSGFLPVSLTGLESVKLLNRVDTKYIFNIVHLDAILQGAVSDYYVLEIDGKRIFRYESVYFDTPGFDLYRQHHNGKPNRVKIRYRQYTDTGEAFFEVKKKVKGSRTDKTRIKLEQFDTCLNPQEQTLMESLQVPAEGLEEKVRIKYDRITFMGINTGERVTLDLNLEFNMGGKILSYPKLVIAEVKQERATHLSPFSNTLRNNNIPRAKVSKYAMAVALLGKEVKRNAFKSTINKINKIVAQ